MRSHESLAASAPLSFNPPSPPTSRPDPFLYAAPDVYVTAARETHNLEEECSDSLHATILSVGDVEIEAWHRGRVNDRPGVCWSQI